MLLSLLQLLHLQLLFILLVIGHQLRLLETFLRQPLTARQGRNLILTDEGREYYRAIRSAFSVLPVFGSWSGAATWCRHCWLPPRWASWPPWPVPLCPAERSLIYQARSSRCSTSWQRKQPPMAGGQVCAMTSPTSRPHSVSASPVLAACSTLAAAVDVSRLTRSPNSVCSCVWN